MNKSSTAVPKTPRSARIISAEVVQAHRDRRLCERAMAGDVDAAIAWLTKFGGDKWKPTA